jgi:hypothetical protein
MIVKMDYAALFAAADAAGVIAAAALEPVPMVVCEADLFGKPVPGAQRYFVADGVCGFAWVKVRPATSGLRACLREGRQRGRDLGLRRQPDGLNFQRKKENGMGMKLGHETGSVMNHLYSRGTIGQPTPVVGMGATVLAWTDRYAATIVSVEEIGGSKRYRYIVGVARDKATVIAGNSFDGSAEYAYERNERSGVELWASKVDGGAWVAVKRNEAGRLVKREGNGLRIGERDEYRDPSF